MITDILGYIGAFLMGISLGVIGGGGSIFSVPILVYIFGVNPVIATAYSLFIVGLTSLSGSINHIRLGNINWKAVFFFGIPSITTVFITRTLLIPLIPDPVFVGTAMQVPKPTFFLRSRFCGYGNAGAKTYFFSSNFRRVHVGCIFCNDA